MQACGNKVIVEETKKESISKGGIYLGENGVGIRSGVVLSVGDGRATTENVPCKKGDVVYFYNRSYTEVQSEDSSRVLILTFDDILYKFE